MRLPQRAVPALALALCAALASGACSRPSAARTDAGAPAAPAPAPPALTAAGAYEVVSDYLDLIASGGLQAAYGLWAPSWQAQHPEAAWAAGPPLPAGASTEIGAPSAQGGSGSFYVPVRVGVTTAAGERWADGGYTVVQAGGQSVLSAGGLAPPVPPLDLQALAVPLAGGGQSGQAACGDYAVAWKTGPAAGPGGGRTSTISITAAGGAKVPAPPVPPFSFGTVPTSCGDLFGDGGEELVLTTATATAGAYRQASVYRFDGTAAPRLLGQMASVGDSAEPAPESPDGMYPFLMVASAEIGQVGSSPILAPVYWSFNGVLFENDTADLRGILQADLAANLQRLGAKPACKPAPQCEAPELLGAYYDQEELGEKGAGLAHLDALVAAGSRAWLDQQAATVDYVLGEP